MTTPTIIQTVSAMTDAFHQAHLDQVMSFYESEASVAFQPGQLIQEREQIEESFRSAFSAKPRFLYGAHEVMQVADLAMHLAPWTMNAVLPDGTDIEEQGLSVAVLRRQPDGSWKIVLDNPHAQHLWESRSKEGVTSDGVGPTLLRDGP